MSKFVIECPFCGRYAEARTGFFARKKIDCACGHIIDVRTDKMTSRQCPHCGNMVVFDQSRGADAKCPVCHEPINTMAEQNQMVEFACSQCGVLLQTSKSARTYICPVCDCANDVAERVMSAKIKKDGLASIIKYEGDNETLVWKHPVEDFNMGSQLIVHESQEAVFFRDGQALDSFGAGRYTLSTQQLPLLEKVYQLPIDSETAFHSEVYFVNLATQMGIKWGTDSKVRLFDPASGLHVELGASGEFNIRVTNARRLLLKVVGTSGGMKQDALVGGNGKGYFRAMIMTQVKSFLAQTIRENAINVLEIDEHLMELSSALQVRINATLQPYGLEMPEFYVSRVVTPDDDPNFRRMKEQYADQYLLVREEQIKRREAETAAERKRVEAQTAAQMKIIGAQGDAEALKIQKQAEAEAYRMQAEAEAAEMRMKGFTYQQQTSREVGMQAMKNGIGGEGGGALGDIAGLGVSLGMLGGVVDMTRAAVAPAVQATKEVIQAADGWTCPECGAKDNKGKFCAECGAKKPEPQPAAAWDCPECGAKGNKGKFCPECGAKRPVPRPLTWDCPECGEKDIKGKFCPECGHKREG